jgi:hypothetical protein
VTTAASSSSTPFQRAHIGFEVDEDIDADLAKAGARPNRDPACPSLLGELAQGPGRIAY